MFVNVFVLFLKILGCGALIIFLYLFFGWPKTYTHHRYGITWSTDYARYLGLDPYEGLEAALRDLSVRHVRLPTYWTHVEPQRGHVDWLSIDRQLSLIERYQGTVTLVLGAKQPRWPECWMPDWAKRLSKEERRVTQLAYVRRTVERYKRRSSIVRWQVENEPHFFGAFGDCAEYDPTLLEEEIPLVRDLDTSGRSLSTTASGELSTWLREPKDVDIGTSIYRVVANPWMKRWSYWFFPSWFYGRKATLRESLFRGKVYVSEFQMEPWVQGDILKTSNEDQFHTFDVKQMKKNLLFARRLKLPEIHFWGAEWWYWMKIKQGHPEFWEEMKTVF